MTFVPTLMLIAALSQAPSPSEGYEDPREARQVGRVMSEVGLGLLGGATLAFGTGSIGQSLCPLRGDFFDCGWSAISAGFLGLIAGHALGVGLGGWLFDEPFSFFKPLLGAFLGGVAGFALLAVTGLEFGVISLALPLTGAVLAYEGWLPPVAQTTPVAGFAFRF